MTCWKCNAEQAGAWAHCQACGALTRANVEAVCRGVASLAVEVRTWHGVTVSPGESGWEAAVYSTPGGHALHPTRHGAALAAFEEAWREGAEPRPTRLPVGEPGPHPMCRCVPVASDVERIEPGALVAVDAEGQARPAAPSEHGWFGKMSEPSAFATAYARSVRGWTDEDLPRVLNVLAAYPSGEWLNATDCGDGTCGEAAEVIRAEMRRRERAETEEMARASDRELVGEWCEANDGELIAKDDGAFSVVVGKRGVGAVVPEGVPFVARSIGVPDDVADAMGRLAREALL